MSFISSMIVDGGVIMMADGQATAWPNLSSTLSTLKELNAHEGDIIYLRDSVKQFTRVTTRTEKKLFTMGDNIGINFATAEAFQGDKPLIGLIEDFCMNNNYTNIREAAHSLLQYLCEHRKAGVVTAYIAGYDVSENKYRMYQVTTWHPNTGKEETTIYGERGFSYRASNSHVRNLGMVDFRDFSLQDAIDYTKFAFDTSRGMMRFYDKVDSISDDFEMIAIMRSGIQWIKKRELRVN
jgi:hypothetical protein